MRHFDELRTVQFIILIMRHYTFNLLIHLISQMYVITYYNYIPEYGRDIRSERVPRK